MEGLTHWTIALWVKWRDGPNTYEHPIGLGVGHDATFWFSGTIVAFKTQDASGNTVLDGGLSWSIAPGVWYHLAATFDGTTVKAYLDGVEKFSIAAPTTTIRSNSVKVGTSGSQGGNFFNGTIDEVLVYNRALNASEIAGVLGATLSVRLGVRAVSPQDLFTHDYITNVAHTGSTDGRSSPTAVAPHSPSPGAVQQKLNRYGILDARAWHILRFKADETG